MRSIQNAAQFPAPPHLSALNLPTGLTLVDLDPPTLQLAGVSAAWRKLLMQAEMAAPHIQVAALEKKYTGFTIPQMLSGRVMV